MNIINLFKENKPQFLDKYNNLKLYNLCRIENGFLNFLFKLCNPKMSLQRKINNWLRQKGRIDSRVFMTMRPYLLSAPLYKSTVVKSQTKVPKNCSTISFFC